MGESRPSIGGRIPMVSAMNEIEKHAAFYRGYLADDRRLASVIGVLLTAIALWLLFYLVSLVGPASDQRTRLGARPAYAAARAATP